MDDKELSMFYPTFAFSPDGRVVPSVPLPRDYKELVPIFYEQGRQERVEEVAEKLIKFQNLPQIQLKWHKLLGLTNISLGTHPGFDLDEDSYRPAFQEHNLNGKYSLGAIVIATKYVSELLKSR